MSEQKTWSIVETSNYGRDYPDESFVCQGFQNKGTAELVCEFLNGQTSIYAERWNIVVEAGYELQPGFEP